MATVAFMTLGCKVNQEEAEALKNMFRQRGYQVVPFNQAADVYVVHTCTVTHMGDNKSRQMIRRATRTNPKAVVAATGCYAQVSPSEVQAIPGVDLILGTRERRHLVDLVEEIAARRSAEVLVESFAEDEPFEDLGSHSTSKSRAFLKIQEGCRKFCSYCIVPYARGPNRSLPPDRALSRAAALVKEGFHEIVLTGIHIGTYGEDLPQGTRLAGLIKSLLKMDDTFRLRLGSLDPNEVDEELLEVLTAEERVCPHFHLALQSGDNQILARMGRRYTAEQYIELVDRLRARRPGIALTTDVIVGFPGEGERQFRHTEELIRRAAMSALHVFKYSPRKGTPAAAFTDQVPDQVKETRSRRLIDLGRELGEAYAKSFVGRQLTVLIESKAAQGQRYKGHAENYLVVTLEGTPELVGSLVPVKVVRHRAGLIVDGEQLELL